MLCIGSFYTHARTHRDSTPFNSLLALIFSIKNYISTDFSFGNNQVAQMVRSFLQWPKRLAFFFYNRAFSIINQFKLFLTMLHDLSRELQFEGQMGAVGARWWGGGGVARTGFGPSLWLHTHSWQQTCQQSQEHGHQHGNQEHFQLWNCANHQQLRCALRSGIGTTHFHVHSSKNESIMQMAWAARLISFSVFSPWW